MDDDLDINQSDENNLNVENVEIEIKNNLSNSDQNKPQADAVVISWNLEVHFLNKNWK